MRVVRKLFGSGEPKTLGRNTALIPPYNKHRMFEFEQIEGIILAAFADRSGGSGLYDQRGITAIQFVSPSRMSNVAYVQMS